MAWAFMTSKSQPNLRARAMRLLARREHSREELRRKLAAKAQEGEDIDTTLDDLCREGWLSDSRYAEQAIRAKSRRFGRRMLEHRLREKGVSEEAIAQAFRSAGEEGASSLDRVWGSRFRAPPSDDREKARQVRFLQARGFGLEEIFRHFKNLKEKP